MLLEPLVALKLNFVNDKLLFIKIKNKNLKNHLQTLCIDHIITQAISRWSLAAETQVRARVNLCGICGGQSGTGTGFPPSKSVSLSASFQHLSTLIYLLPMLSAIALTEHHIIILSVLSYWLRL
jgi:hypothetical protein